MSNHPQHDALSSQIFFIFSLFVDILLKWSVPENFNPELITIPKLLRFENLTEMGVLG